MGLPELNNPQAGGPQNVKVSGEDIYAGKRTVASIKFEDQKLTSFSGLVVFQKLFERLGLRQKIDAACRHLDRGRSYQFGTIVELLITHILLGYRKLRDVDFYRDDPMVKLLLRLKRLPGVATISRMLAEFDEHSVDQHHELNRRLVIERAQKARLRRVTLDFDGSVQSTKRHAEGTAVGFNKKKKGARSYYPLFCTVAQIGEVLDVLHRSGNVHDSNGAREFVLQCVRYVRRHLPGVIIEVRMDSAFFSDELVEMLDAEGVEYTISVPFMRFAALKTFVEGRKLWWWLNQAVGYFEKRWKPEAWGKKARFLFIRKEVAVQQKGPIQLDMFEPQDHDYEFKVIVTNKKVSARKVVKYHEGRGYQENIFSELKSQGAMDYVPVRTWIGNKIYLLCNLLAHNLVRELQMQAQQPVRRTTEKRTPLWIFEGIEVVRRTFIQRAGRLSTPCGVRTLTMSANAAVRRTLLHYLAAA
jgi:hypothetical protein